MCDTTCTTGISLVVLYSLYKNCVLVSTMFCYGAFTGWTGTPPPSPLSAPFHLSFADKSIHTCLVSLAICLFVCMSALSFSLSLSQTLTHTHIHIHIHIHTLTQAHIRSLTQKHTQTVSCAKTCTHTHTHTHTHTRTFVESLTLIHKYMRPHFLQHMHMSACSCTTAHMSHVTRTNESCHTYK